MTHANNMDETWGHYAKSKFSSVSQPCPNSLQPDGQGSLEHASPSPTPGAYSKSCPSSQWCHPIISSCCPLLLPTSIFPSTRVFSNESVSSHQMASFNIRVSASTSILPTNTKDWFPLGWTGWISCSPRDSQESSPTPQFKSISSLALSFMVQLSHPYMTAGKTIALTIRTFVGKVTILFFNMLSRFVIAFLPRGKHLLNFIAAVTICSDFGAQENKVTERQILYDSTFVSS